MQIKKIAVGTDFSQEASLAANQALDIARHVGASVTLVHSGNVPAPPDKSTLVPAGVREYQEMLEEALKEDRERLEEQRSRLAGQGVELSHVVIDDFPDTGLCRAAEEMAADLIVVGTHGRTGLKRFLLGSVAERVVRLSPTSVMVARPVKSSAGGYRKILVPTDFSESADNALNFAMMLAADGAEVKLLHCWQLPPGFAGFSGGYVPRQLRESTLDSVTKGITEGAEQRATDLIKDHQRDGVNLSFEVMQAPPVHGIEQRAEDSDLIVMGSHGRRGVRRFVLGSVAEVTVRHAPCSVLVTHGPAVSE